MHERGCRCENTGIALDVSIYYSLSSSLLCKLVLDFYDFFYYNIVFVNLLSIINELTRVKLS